jgi:K+/H+ antiporter YhaU regulatory subunit KhtT
MTSRKRPFRKTSVNENDREKQRLSIEEQEELHRTIQAILDTMNGLSPQFEVSIQALTFILGSQIGVQVRPEEFDRAIAVTANRLKMTAVRAFQSQYS